MTTIGDLMPDADEINRLSRELAAIVGKLKQRAEVHDKMLAGLPDDIKMTMNLKGGSLDWSCIIEVHKDAILKMIIEEMHSQIVILREEIRVKCNELAERTTPWVSGT